MKNQYRRTLLISSCIVAIALLSGCSVVNDLIFGAAEPTATTTPEARVLIPTFTPTAEGVQAAAPTPAPVEAAPVATAVPAEEAPAPDVAPEATVVQEEPTVAPTEAPPSARLFVTGELVNVRSGPTTNYGLVGTAAINQEFEIVAKSPDGAWWQICCVNGQQAWIFGQLARVENADAVAIAQNIPPEPVPPTPVPVPPTAVPEPAAAAPAAPAAGPDPCANIGGDGCKFKVRNGPLFGENGGQQLKLQLGFIHTGVDGGQAQGSYFVGLEKDGARLPVSDSVRSLAKNKQSGQLGQYNYEFSMGVDQVGGSVAGNYSMWVIDGNGERDSRNFNFSISNGNQGLVWIEWDQN